ncbi:MAG TPA: hypothetical protein VMW50_03565 [Dehalococcoidia bacterium]|nr:hypothetical protein [Dehalococcoidia bacterium]
MSSVITNTVINAAGQEVVYSYPGDRYLQPDRKDARRIENKTAPGEVAKKKGWQVAEMWDRHHEIARRIILGQNNQEIGEALNVTAQQVSNVRNSPVVQDKITIMRAARDAGTIDLAKDIADLAPIALQRVREALETGQVLGRELSGSSIMKEANNLMDREIGKPTQRIDTRNVHGHFTLDDIERIKERARELAGFSGQMAIEPG